MHSERLQAHHKLIYKYQYMHTYIYVCIYINICIHVCVCTSSYKLTFPRIAGRSDLLSTFVQHFIEAREVLCVDKGWEAHGYGTDALFVTLHDASVIRTKLRCTVLYRSWPYL